MTLCLNKQGDNRNSLAKLEYYLNVLRCEKNCILDYAVTELKSMLLGLDSGCDYNQDNFKRMTATVNRDS